MTGLAVIAVSAMTSCKKDKITNVIAAATTDTTTVTPPAPISIAENIANLTDKTFIMTAWTSSPAWYGVLDVYANTEACYKDNTVIYKADGTLVLDKGKLVDCDSITPVSGTWSFNEDATIMTVGDLTYNIVTNDGTTLKYTTEVDDNGKTLVWTLTFIKQTATQNLTDKTFIMTAWTSSPAWYGITDVFAVTEDCYKDNTVVYDVDGTLSVNTGALTACDTITPTSGVWAFNTEGNTMTIKAAVDSTDFVSYTIIENDGTTLKYSVPFLDTAVTPAAIVIWT